MQRDKIKPILFSIIKHTDSEELKRQLPKDVVSGVMVAVVALPLSIALAIASGVSPEQGLYTAIVAGFFIAFLGGSRVQISGPTAAFATIVAGIVATDGMDGLVGQAAGRRPKHRNGQLASVRRGSGLPRHPVRLA